MLGARFNNNKLKWSLVSWKALEPLVQVLMFGASKYTKVNFKEVKKHLEVWNVTLVTEIEKLEQKDYVEPVTKNNYLQINQKLERQLENIKNIIDLKMKSVLNHMINQGHSLEVMIQSIKTKEGVIITNKDMEFPQKKWISLNKRDVQFVKEPHLLCTQTIVIPLENSEVSFVVNATMDLDSLMIISFLLLEFLNISLNIESFIISGDNNWKKGLKYTETCESLQRHLNSFIEGEDNDKESKLSHVGHILCNAMFLSYMSMFRKDLDDRFIDKNFKNDE